jgi:UDP-N-acetylmuramyl pentapeptide synthase
MQVTEWSDGTTIINDAYNTNPASTADHLELPSWST